MDRKKILVIAVVLAGIGILAAQFLPGEKPGPKGVFVSDGEEIAEITLELAETGEERREGLMDRKNLPENRGMLFIYPGEKERSFWMKNTYIPLDIVFIDSDNRIVDIRKAFPEPDTPEGELKIYRGGPAMYVLEVNQNFTERKGIEEGDRFVFNRSR